ncbi:MAG: hypothetical protein HUJ90_07160, partial [Bacteroidales bacterium]|nr:hypothetical protein [Bacteroidales bacterium]
DQAVSNVMLNILYEDHPITVKVYIESMVPEDQLLGKNVPKSLLRYKLKLTELECNRITKEIEAADNGENSDIQQVLIKNLMLLNKVKNALSKEINRI